MPLEISEDLVSLACQSLGHFVTEGRRAGRNEIDLLAVRLGGAGEVVERLHIFGDHCYQCVFVHGTIKEPRQLGVIESCAVRCIPVGELVAQAVSACERDHNHNRLCRAREIARLLMMP